MNLGVGKEKTSDILPQNIGTFEVKHRNFSLEKSDVSALFSKKPLKNSIKIAFRTSES